MPPVLKARDRATAKTATDLKELWHEHLKSKKERASESGSDVEVMRTGQPSSDEGHMLDRRLL
jgi:hypothetical protein